MTDPLARDRIRLTAAPVDDFDRRMTDFSWFRTLYRYRGMALAGCGLAAVWLVLSYLGMPVAPEPSEPAETNRYAWPQSTSIQPEDWTVFQRATGAAPSPLGPLAQRYRLAGTFFAYRAVQSEDVRSSRRAILDDIRNREQYIVQEGEQVSDVEIVSIFRDRVVIRSGGNEEELWLSFAGAPGPSGPAPRTSGPETPLRFEDAPALETSRFGKRIAENQWVIRREELVAYIDELQDDPERLANIFLAMEPVYDEDEAIDGFQLRMNAEDVLYRAVGFEEGDIVRMVNHIPMTSGARAQYFISEFLNERISALVFDIEREGEEAKLIHLIR